MSANRKCGTTTIAIGLNPFVRHELDHYRAIWRLVHWPWWYRGDECGQVHCTLSSRCTNPLMGKCSATLNNMKLVHCPLTGGLLHLVPLGGDLAGPLLAVQNVTAHAPINGTDSVQITVILLYFGSLLCRFNVLIKQLNCMSTRTPVANVPTPYNALRTSKETDQLGVYFVIEILLKYRCTVLRRVKRRTEPNSATHYTSCLPRIVVSLKIGGS